MVGGDLTVEKGKQHSLYYLEQMKDHRDRRGRGEATYQRGPGLRGRRMNLILFISYQSTSTMSTVHIVRRVQKDAK